MRLLILGGPKAGKTTLANAIGRARAIPVRHTDDVINLPWSEQSEEVARWIAQPGPWIIEGCSTARAARKALARHDSQVLDGVMLVYLCEPVAARTPGQIAMAAGVRTVVIQLRVLGLRVLQHTYASASEFLLGRPA